MIPPKLGDAWIPKVLVTNGKETHHAILNLGSSVSILSKELYEFLERQNIDLLLADDSNGYMVEFTSNVCNYYERGGDKSSYIANNNYKLQGNAVNIH
jgi:hypothetical protein